MILQDDLEEPIIMIIASAKIYLYEEKVQVGHVWSTKFFLNYHHHSVAQLRQRYNSGDFSEEDFSSVKVEKVRQFNLEEILNLGPEFTKKEVICNVKIWKVATGMGWFFRTCTSYYRENENVDELFKCVMCNSDIPHPLKKFRIYAETLDSTGEIGIILEDREVRSLIGKTVYDFIDEECNEKIFPEMLKQIADKEYSVKLLIKQANIEKSCKSYLATDIYEMTLLCESEEINLSCEIDKYQDSPLEVIFNMYLFDLILFLIVTKIIIILIVAIYMKVSFG
ncbi:uncharacterized protein LOC141702079 [Apium graveolens]|uniref:uncharacterized protein LOC141702079 n=1 Tax=Apium graveolens TaxID=4045 RepID=UPI003D7A67C5